MNAVFRRQFRDVGGENRRLFQGQQQAVRAVGRGGPAVEAGVELVQFFQVHVRQFGRGGEVQLGVDLHRGEIGFVGDGAQGDA